MRKLALVLLVAACGGGNDDHHMVILEPDAAPDTPVDTPPRQPIAMELDVYGTPALVAYRDGAGAWQTPSDDGQGRYTLMVTDDYEVVVACADASGSQATLLAATVDDPSQYAFCSGSSGTATTVAVTGQMVQPGTVFMGDQATGSAANWSFTLNVDARLHDLIAVDDTHHMAIQRGIDITGATTLDPIDLAGADAMSPITLTLGGVGAGDMLYTGLDLLTANDFATFQSTTASLYVPPASLLGSSDYELLFAEAYDATSYRYVNSRFTGTETSFTLPDPLTGIAFGKARASWSALPAMYDGAELMIDQGSGQVLVEQVVRATRRWIDATHATTLTFDAQPPGFQDAWNVDTGGSYTQSFDIGYSAGMTSYGAAVYDQSHLVRQDPKRAWLSTVARVRASMRSQHTMPRR